MTNAQWAHERRRMALIVLGFAAVAIATAALLFFTEFAGLTIPVGIIAVILLGHAVWELVEGHKYARMGN